MKVQVQIQVNYWLFLLKAGYWFGNTVVLLSMLVYKNKNSNPQKFLNVFTSNIKNVIQASEFFLKSEVVITISGSY